MPGTEQDPQPDDAFDPVAQYRDTRARLVELGRSLTEEEGEAMVAATPMWSVKDVYSHIAGSAADLLAGNLEGVTTDPWTAAQVTARRDRTLADVLDEMESTGAAMDSLIESLGEANDVRLFIDQWTHEQDLRGTLGIAGGVDSPIVAEASPGMARGWVRRSARAGLPPLTVLCDGETYTADDGTDAGEQPGSAQLTVDGFTAMRVGLGRRSRAQMAVLDWAGTADPAPWFEHLVFFSIAEQDVTDAR